MKNFSTLMGSCGATSWIRAQAIPRKAYCRFQLSRPKRSTAKLGQSRITFLVASGLRVTSNEHLKCFCARISRTYHAVGSINRSKRAMNRRSFLYVAASSPLLADATEEVIRKYRICTHYAPAAKSGMPGAYAGQVVRVSSEKSIDSSTAR